MQKILYTAATVAIAAVTFSSCKDNPNSRIEAEGTSMPSLSTAEMARFQKYEEWKEFQEWKEAKDNKAKSNTVYYTVAAPKRQAVKTRTVRTSAPVAVATQPAKKKGWSKAAKGTAIGAGVGAAAGAIIAKNNRALGAVIGGVAGGGVGYGIGRSMDKKDGRY